MTSAATDHDEAEVPVTDECIKAYNEDNPTPDNADAA